MKIDPLALADLLDLVAYIASNDLGGARRLHAEIRRQTDTLATDPKMGRLGRVTGTRELVITGTPYLAAYRIADELVTILRVLHESYRRRRRSILISWA